MERVAAHEPETVRAADGRIVARMARLDGMLNGECRWLDRSGTVVAIGWFVRGQPFAGTILNWSRFLPPTGGAAPFGWDYYARDWITPFEAAFDSEPPDYGAVLETYLRGRKL